MRKALLFGVSLLLFGGAFAQEKEKPLNLTIVKVTPEIEAYEDRQFVPAIHSVTLAPARKDLLLPAVQWSSDSVTYTIGITPQKLVFRAKW